jgi:hypothetical protein
VSFIVKGQVSCAPLGPLVFATDGSVARKTRRNHLRQHEYLTGYGWLSTHGHWGAGACPQPTALAGADPVVVAELRAVWHAIGAHLPHGHVTVLTDSQNACEWLTRWRAGSRALPAGYVGSQTHTPRLLVMANGVRRYRHNLTVTWVKGHNGHLLNEAADSLAKVGRLWLVQRLEKGRGRRQGAVGCAGVHG